MDPAVRRADPPPDLDRPAMTIALMVDRRRERGARALKSLLRQSAIDRLEIVLLDFGGPQAAPLPGSSHPNVRTIRLHRGLPYGVAKALAVRAARAPVVAFVEEHCRYSSRWAAAILAEFSDGVGAVTGEVYNAVPRRGISDLVALAVSGPWSAPARLGPSRSLPGNNSAYRRALLLEQGPELDALLAAEPLLQARVRPRGVTFRIAAGKYVHEYEVVMRDVLIPSFLNGRIYGARRAEVERWGRGRRALAVMVAPARFAIQVVRLPLHIALRPAGWRRAARAWPVVAAIQLATHAGLVLGTLFGVGRAEVTLLDYDLNARRSAAR
jgi:hypothetical protein